MFSVRRLDSRLVLINLASVRQERKKRVSIISYLVDVDSHNPYHKRTIHSQADKVYSQSNSIKSHCTKYYTQIPAVGAGKRHKLECTRF